MLMTKLGVKNLQEQVSSQALAGLDPRFGRIVRIAARLCGAKSAYLSVLDGEFLFHKAKLGGNVKQEHLRDHLAQDIFVNDAPLVVQDSKQSARFCDHPMVCGDAAIRFFAGVPVHTAHSGLIGCLYICDEEPKHFDDTDLEDLRDIGQLAGDLLETTYGDTSAEIESIAPQATHFSDHFASAIGNAFMSDFSLGIMLAEVTKNEKTQKPDANLVWVNRSAAAHLSVLHPGRRQVPLSKLLPQTTARPLTEALINVSEMPRLRHLRFPLVRGSKIEHFDAKMVPCGHQIVVLFSNVTDEVETELHALKTVELFRQMTGLISHDMRGPLRRICQFIDILREEGAIEQPEHAEFFQIVQAQSRSLSDLLVKSVHYSRTLMCVPEPTLTSIKRSVEEGFAHVMAHGDYGPVSFDTSGSWGMTMGDPKLLLEAFRSLFATMLEFRRPMVRPSISVLATLAGGRQQIQITDNSDPVKETIAGQLFSFRGRRPAPSGEQKMVLGFSLASEIVQDMGGDLMCDTSDRQRFCLLIDLPLGRMPNPDRTSES